MTGVIVIDEEDEAAGGGGGTVAISNDSAIGQLYVSYRYAADGDIDKDLGYGSSDAGDWLSPKTGMGDYEIRGTLIAGTTPDGNPLNLWLNAGVAGVGWEMTTVYLSGIEKNCTLQVDIRRASDGVIVDTASIYLAVQSLA